MPIYIWDPWGRPVLRNPDVRTSQILAAGGRCEKNVSVYSIWHERRRIPSKGFRARIKLLATNALEPGSDSSPTYERLYSKLPVSPLITPIVVPYIIPYIAPFKEFRLLLHAHLHQAQLCFLGVRYWNPNTGNDCHCSYDYACCYFNCTYHNYPYY